jgi:hypothetical protein
MAVVMAVVMEAAAKVTEVKALVMQVEGRAAEGMETAVTEG